MLKRIIAIDSGTFDSAFIICDVSNLSRNAPNIIHKGKWENERLITQLLSDMSIDVVLLEMVASYGMPVGKEIFETVLMIGRMVQICKDRKLEYQLIYRRDIKLQICGSMRANDSNIMQALIDKYAPYVRNRGKGVKNAQGYFYGFHSDIWQAFAILDYYVSKN